MSARSVELGRVLNDRYRIERELGEGGMAVVYLASDLQQHRTVALKVLRPEIAGLIGPERFLREIELAGKLSHPHIVPLFDAGAVVGLPYYVMPFIEGESLRDRLRREEQLPIEEALQITREVAGALAYTHALGVVHRDVTPGNIMLSGGHALLTDFGIAHALVAADAREQLTGSGMSIGTVGYISPEQTIGSADVDALSDQYSLACVLYEMLAGAPPFLAHSPKAVLAKQLADPVPPIRTVRNTVPAPMEAAILSALAKSKADRFPSVGAFLEALEGKRPSPLQPSPGSMAVVPGRVTSAARWKDLVSVELLVATIQRPLAMASMMTVFVLGVFLSWRTGSRNAAGAPVANRIVVSWLENRTGDSSLADLGTLAADWIVDGLSHESFGELVSSTEVRELMKGDLKKSPTAARDLARRTAAGLLVSGSYFRRGDSLEYRAELLDTRRNILVASLGPTRGLPDETLPLDSLQQQVLVAIGDFMNWNSVEPIGIPWKRAANIAAWREDQRATELTIVDDLQGAVEHQRRAIALDPNFLGPRLDMAELFLSMDEFAAADSVLRSLETLTSRFGPFERAVFELARTGLRGDLEGRYRAAKTLQKMRPMANAYILAHSATRANRPTEGLRYIALADSLTYESHPGWAIVQRAALHHLGRFEDELAVTRELVRTHGPSLRQANHAVRELAALHRWREVDSVLAEAWNLRVDNGLAPADLAEMAGWEAIAHGDTAQAPRYFGQLLDWYSRASPEQRTRPAYATVLAYAYFHNGRYLEARQLFDSLWRASPDSTRQQAIEFLGMEGVVETLAGNDRHAAEIDARLARMSAPFLLEAHTWWRGRMAALRGDCERAAELTRQALTHGQGWFDPSTHRWAALGRARECKQLQDVLKPRG